MKVVGSQLLGSIYVCFKRRLGRSAWLRRTRNPHRQREKSDSTQAYQAKSSVPEQDSDGERKQVLDICHRSWRCRRSVKHCLSSASTFLAGSLEEACRKRMRCQVENPAPQAIKTVIRRLLCFCFFCCCLSLVVLEVVEREEKLRLRWIFFFYY